MQTATATIKPTGYGTFGIHWSNFPEMEAAFGGYSGPFSSVEDASDRAYIIAANYGRAVSVLEDAT